MSQLRSCSWACALLGDGSGVAFDGGGGALPGAFEVVLGAVELLLGDVEVVARSASMPAWRGVERWWAASWWRRASTARVSA